MHSANDGQVKNTQRLLLPQLFLFFCRKKCGGATALCWHCHWRRLQDSPAEGKANPQTFGTTKRSNGLEHPSSQGQSLVPALGGKLWRTGNSSKDLGRERTGGIYNLHCHFSDSRGKWSLGGLFSSSEGLVLLSGSLSASCKLRSVTLVTLHPASAQIVLHALSSVELKGWSCHWGNVLILTFLR